MNDRCDEFDRLVAASANRSADGAHEEILQEHLARCGDCREQAAADTLLRAALDTPPPQLAAGFEERLRQRLEERVGAGPAAARPALGVAPRLRWVLAAYGTVATAASVVILARLPWETFAPPMVLGLTLAGLALLSPLVLLDRIGLVRPPG